MSITRLINARGVSSSSVRAATGRGYIYDEDAEAYIASVESADGQRLEWGVRQAISQFVAGCKADSVWTPIKASCILMGARTLSGALTPLVGSAPTNVNFVSGDYDRKLGLAGNASNKYLNTNRNNNTSGQNDFHLACYVDDPNSVNGIHIGAGTAATSGASLLRRIAGSIYWNMRDANGDTQSIAFVAGSRVFCGASRSAAASYTQQFMGRGTSITRTSQTPFDGNLFVFATNNAGTPATYTNARISFYSTGDAITLSSLSARVCSLYWGIQAAIA